MKSCQRTTGIMGAVIDGTVPFKVRMGVGAHVIMCRHCRLYFKQMRDVVDLMRHIEPREALAQRGPSAEVEAMLRQAFTAKYGRG